MTATSRKIAVMQLFANQQQQTLLATLVVHSLLDSPLYIVTEGTWYPLMLGVLAAGAWQRPERTELP